LIHKVVVCEYLRGRRKDITVEKANIVNDESIEKMVINRRRGMISNQTYRDNTYSTSAIKFFRPAVLRTGIFSALY